MEAVPPTPPEREPAGGLSLNAQILIGAVAGVALGLLLKTLAPAPDAWPGITGVLQLVGDLFIALLKMTVIPLVLTSVVTGIYGLAGHRNAGQVWKWTLAFLILTPALAAVTGLTLVNLIGPGEGLDPGVLSAGETPANLQTPSATQFLRDLLIGSFMNPFKALAEGQVFPVLVFAVFLGTALIAGGERSRPLASLFDSAYEVFMRMITWILKLAPAGVFALMALLILRLGLEALSKLALFALVAVGGTLIHGIITLPVLLRAATGYPILKFLRAMRPAMVTALSTSSSSATLPVTLECVEKGLGVRKDIAKFFPTLGATANMDGTALYEATAALFVAQLYGIELSLVQQVIVVAMSMIAAIGAPGIPSAGMVTMILVLQSVGLPVEAIAFLLPIDRPLDAVRTMVNVEGDGIGAVFIEKFSDRKVA